MASIQERKGRDGLPRYRVQVRLKGHPPQSATFRRKTDAKQWANSVETAIIEGRYFKTRQARKRTLAELIDRYIEEELPGKRDWRNRKRHLLWWREHLGDYTLADVTPDIVSDHKHKLRRRKNRAGKGLSPATVNRYLAALSHAFSVAQSEWQWAEYNPCTNVGRLKEPPGRKRFLSDDERGRLLKACERHSHPYLYTIVVLALSTGARFGEIMGLRWRDVDLERGEAVLFDTKNDETRSLPLAGAALRLLKGLVMAANGDGLLFPSKDDPERPSVIKKAWHDVLRTAEVQDFRFHDLRHSAASYLAMNGATSSEIAAVLGHKTLQMVKRYSHIADEHKKAVVGQMNAKIFGE